ncbi:MAG: PadR family transcriptional regulator [Deltaproteobacteria bacterium]|jgi:DNA-binding PadR family transcriptional regulator|nr:PadR family transcriptional regulator [Deltaproteobacteria bacterium]
MRRYHYRHIGRHYRRRHRRHRRGRTHFGPWAWQGRFFGRGEVGLALLSLLEDGPKHGYELMTLLEERTEGCYQASSGTIYPTLQQLQDQGLVASSEEEGGRRTYQLTDAGRSKLEEEAEAIAEIWGRLDEDDWGGWSHADHPDAAELIRPCFRLMQEAVRAVGASDDPEVREKVRAILRRTREEIRELRRERSS